MTTTLSDRRQARWRLVTGPVPKFEHFQSAGELPCPMCVHERLALPKIVPLSATMSTNIDDVTSEYVVHVKVKLPMRSVEAAQEIYRVDVGNLIYDSVKSALQQACELAPDPADRPAVKRGEAIRFLEKPTTRKIDLGDG